jgi:excisionase family DNA binding protein
MASTNVVKLSDRRKEISDDEDDIMTLEEAAAFLKVTRRMLYDRVQRRAIPFLRVGKLLRFEKQALLEWSRKQSHS